MERHELAWAAGFFDGEGWAGKKQPRGVQARINQADVSGAPAVLLRVQRALGGIGAIGGPIVKPDRRPLYSWTVSSRVEVELMLGLLKPWLGPVKLVQLSSAVSRTAPVASEVIPNDEWRAWAAGLFDGEGCSSLLKHRSHPGYMNGELCVTQSSLVGSPDVLRRLLVIVGAGHISGPYRQRGATMDVYRWKAAAFVDIERVLAVLWPWLGEIKRAQAQRMLDVLHTQPALPRGNPAWGNRKTHCVHGHEYATARIRPYLSRGSAAPRRENQTCLVCLRDYARAQREKRRRSQPRTSAVESLKRCRPTC